MLHTGELLPWFAVRVRSNREEIVAIGLRARDLEEFLPTHRSVRRWSDRVKELRRPLFPGYVFCRLDLQNRLPVLSTPGVVHIVGIGRIPHPVADTEIESVRTIVNSNVMARPWPFLQTGDQVEIVSGPLAGLQGILLKERTRYRLVVSVTILQRSVAVELEGDRVRSIRRSVPFFASLVQPARGMLTGRSD